jgi:hypothetical protein
MPIRRMCCWQGCEATYQGDQPADWRHLLMFWSPRPVGAFVDIPDATWDRDGVLCPQHAAELEGVLRVVGPEPTADA